MARLILLGTSTAVPSPDRGPTSLAVATDQGFLIVDCGENPLRHIGRVGLEAERLRALLLSHFHPDHVAGVVPFLQSLWLLGRKEPLKLLALPEVLDSLWRMLDLFGWDRWDGMFPVERVPLSPRDGGGAVEIAGMRVIFAAVDHLRPALGFRFERADLAAVAYSGDTAPSPAVVRLARRARVLVHEATGDFPGHSTAADAGRTAREAGAERLVLVHYPPFPESYDRWLEEAGAAFDGPVSLGRDGEVYVW